MFIHPINTSISQYSTSRQSTAFPRLLRARSLESKKDEKTGRMSMVPVEGTEKEVPAQLVLIAAGFLGSESYVTESFGVEVDGRTNVKTDPDKHMAINQRDVSLIEKSGSASNGKKSKIFTAGDMHIGQSLVVRAIAEGKAAAKEVDEYLMGYSNL